LRRRLRDGRKGATLARGLLWAFRNKNEPQQE
jgi:hypothetical protein